MESSGSEVGVGTTPFAAPELLFPSKFGLDKPTPAKEADIYAMAMVIYQVHPTQYIVHEYFIPSGAGPHRNNAFR